MMEIKIAARLRPFSHEPGISCLLPGSTTEVTVYPALLCIGGKKIPLAVRGPMPEFTVMQDLEQGCIRVWGKTADGFLRYRLDGKALTVERGSLTIDGQLGIATEPLSSERLSLGSHKLQEWEQLARRRDLREILPLWLRLGQMTPVEPRKERGGTLSLLDGCAEALDSGRPERVVPEFLQLFEAGFHGLLVPHLEDRKHLGLGLPSLSQPASALALLTEGAALIRSLVIASTVSEIALLPCMPPEFFCGRYLNAATPWGTIDLEWTKKAVRQVCLRATKTGDAAFRFPRSVRRFRLRTSRQDRGIELTVDKPIPVIAGALYWLDRFQD